MKKKLAFFDIDKTIIKNDSMFSFLWYGIKRKPLTIFILFPVLFYTLLYKIKIIKAEKVKEYYFYGIKFLEEEDLKEFYKLMLEKNIIKAVLSELKEKKEQGYYILLVSASPYAYVKFFREIPYVDGVIGTNLKTKNNRLTNKIDGANCKGKEKVNRIKSYLIDHNFDIDFNNSCAYSDSLSDLPMFSLVKNKYLVNPKRIDIEELKWDL